MGTVHFQNATIGFWVFIATWIASLVPVALLLHLWYGWDDVVIVGLLPAAILFFGIGSRFDLER